MSDKIKTPSSFKPTFWRLNNSGFYLSDWVVRDFNERVKNNPALAWAKIVDSPSELAVKLIPFLKNKKNGFFIETGANNGFYQSNTLFLEMALGWTGLLIEPNVNQYEACLRARPGNIIINSALVSDENITKIDGYFGSIDPGESLTGKIVETKDKDNEKFNCRKISSVPATTLTKILEQQEIKNIDFFSLDVEGYEHEVIKGLDFNRWQPDLICFESYNRKDFFKIKQKLMKYNYAFMAQLTKRDYLFKHIK